MFKIEAKPLVARKTKHGKLRSRDVNGKGAVIDSVRALKPGESFYYPSDQLALSSLLSATNVCNTYRANPRGRKYTVRKEGTGHRCYRVQ